jgi:hypothetical protein
VLLNANCDDATPEAGARVHRREEAVIGISGVMRSAAAFIRGERYAARTILKREFVRPADDADLFTCPKI